MMKLRSLKRKKYQRYVNRIVRKLNKNIQNDFLWNGRFTVHQKQSKFYTYFDGSGAQLYILLECKDNKTNKTAQCWFETGLFIESYIWKWVNQCIIENFSVWAEDPNPYELAKLRDKYGKINFKEIGKV